MTRLEKLMQRNGIDSIKKPSDDQRIAELEQIIAEQDAALMELAAMLAGGETDG